MPDTTLSLKYSDFKAETGLFLGWGRGADSSDPAWTTRQAAQLDSMVRSGLRRVYVTIADKSLGIPAAYPWSFLHPYTTKTLASGARSVDLPDDFGGLEGPVTVTSSSSTVPGAIQPSSEPMIEKMYADSPEATGRPRVVAVRPLKGTTNTRGQRFDLYVFPQADAAYTLHLSYYILAEALNGDRPYAYGPASMAEVYLESCLAIAEERLDDTRAVHQQAFREQLSAAIAADRRLKPQLQGYNADRSDLYARDGRFDRRSWPGITYNGSQY